MKKVSLLILAVIVISGCKKVPIDFRIPDTNLYITIPATWVQMTDQNFQEAMDHLGERDDLPEDYKESIDVIEQFNRYSFLKPQQIEGQSRNTNLNIITMNLYGEQADLDEIVNSQIEEMKTMQGVESLDLDVCPKLKLNNYRCYSASVSMVGREFRQYQYLTLENGHFVQFALVTSVKDDIEEIAKIARTVTRKKI